MRGCRGGGKQNPKFERQIFRGIDPGVILVYILGNSTHPVCWFQSWTMWWFQRFFSFHPETLGRFHPFAHIFFIPGFESWNQPPNTHENSFREFGTRNTWHLHQAGSWGLVPCSTPDFSWLANHRREVSPAGGASEVSLPWPRIWKSCRGWDWLDGTWVRYTR